MGMENYAMKLFHIARVIGFFSLDSDERCTIEVRDEILALIENAPLDIYKVPRKNSLWVNGLNILVGIQTLDNLNSLEMEK